MADEKLIVLKPGVVVQHKKKTYRTKYDGDGKFIGVAIPESVVVELVSIKLGTENPDKKAVEKALKAWREKYELVEKGADVDQNASAEGNAAGA